MAPTTKRSASSARDRLADRRDQRLPLPPSRGRQGARGPALYPDRQGAWPTRRDGASTPTSCTSRRPQRWRQRSAPIPSRSATASRSRAGSISNSSSASSISPGFKAAAGRDLEATEAEMTRRAEGLAHRLAEIRARSAASSTQQPYHERLIARSPAISEMGFSGYMLIVADFIGYARSMRIPVGPGRGSVVGSLVVLRARNHRTRSDRAQAAVRAMAQSGAQVDAGYRRRFLLTSGATRS